MARRIALVLEYEGTAYAGFQRQANAPSVQAAVEEAIKGLTGSPVRLKGAGRTDAGVHAQGQVVVFDTLSTLPTERFRAGLNHYLPEDIAVTAVYDADEGFDPRRHAVARVYRYTLRTARARSPLRRRHVHQVEGDLDLAKMAEALAYVEGDRDFAPFAGVTGQGKSTRRHLYRAEVWREGAEVHIELEGSAFLPQQVRRIAGAVLRVGQERMTVDDFRALADGAHRGSARWVLPPRGSACVR